MLNLISGCDVEDLASLHGLSSAVENPGFVKVGRRRGLNLRINTSRHGGDVSRLGGLCRCCICDMFCGAAVKIISSLSVTDSRSIAIG